MKIKDIISEQATQKRAGLIPIVDARFRDGNMNEPESYGTQSDVYAHPKSGEVVKVARLQQPFTDDAFVHFVDLALHHQDNPFFVKIKSAKIYSQSGVREDHDGVMVVVTERLTPIARCATEAFESCGPNLKYIIKFLERQLNNSSDEESDAYLDTFKRCESKNSKVDEATAKWFMQTYFLDLFASPELKYIFNNTDLITVQSILAPTLRMHGSDMHYGNMMMRGKQLVVFDPVRTLSASIRSKLKLPTNI